MRRIALWLCASLVSTTFVLGSGFSPASAAGDTTKTMTPNAAPLKVTNKASGNVLVKFQGLAGQVISVATSAGTFVGNCDANLSLLNTDLVTVMSGPVCAGISGSITGV